MDYPRGADAADTIDGENASALVNGDDDMAAAASPTDEGTAVPMPEDVNGDIEDETRFIKRRTTRRHPRPKFRATRRARRTPR